MQIINLIITMIIILAMSYHSYNNGNTYIASTLFKMALIFPAIYIALVIILTI